MRNKSRIGMAMLLTAGGILAQPAPKPATLPSGPSPAAAPVPAAPLEKKFKLASGRSADIYRQGVRLLDERQYERAIQVFDAVIVDRGTRTEGAYYWKAYALRRLGKNSEALGALSELESGYPGSRWKNDAKALEVEIRQASGSGAPPASQDDEELKLLALNGLVQNEPESAVPLLEKMLTSGKSSPRMKQRALYVLAQSKNAKARELVTQYARGGSNPDIQLTAIDYLGAMGTPEGAAALADIYRSSTDGAVKRVALQGMARGRDKSMLLQVAKNESDLDLKKEAIRYLGRGEFQDALKEMYRTETDHGVRTTIIWTIGDHGKPGPLVELARAEKDPAMKKEIVRRLSEMRSKEAQAYLLELLQE
ncbi:MAG: HEAT repeat domain-containing protein [Acidobacteria bacterium]|nr:HEAT repeat domain-containing protein [Acidobacteriota bacterium]